MGLRAIKLKPPMICVKGHWNKFMTELCARRPYQDLNWFESRGRTRSRTLEL